MTHNNSPHLGLRCLQILLFQVSAVLVLIYQSLDRFMFKIRPQGYKNTHLISAEHGILNAHKYKMSRNSAFSGSVKPKMPDLFFRLRIVKMPTCMSRKNFMHS